MKKYLLLAIACVLGLFNLNAQKTVTIGEGSEASSDLPYNNSWCYSASQQIYSTNELNFNGAGSALVKSIAFKSATENNNENYIQVYMVNTNKKSYADADEWVPVTEKDKVYEGYFTASGKDQWSKIELNTPFICRSDRDLVLSVNICYEYKLSSNEQDQFYVYGSPQDASAYSCTLRADSLIDVTKINADTFKDDESGYSSPLSPLRNQLKLEFAESDELVANYESIDMGNIALGDYKNEKEQGLVVVRATSVYSYITSITCSDTSFFKLPKMKVDGTESSVDFVLSYDKNATAGVKTAEITITDEEGKSVVIPVKANVYDPVSPDVFELAKAITFTDGVFTDEPDSTKLYDDYLLPNERLDSYAPDAVYTIEIDEEVLVLVDVEGVNAKYSLYEKDFDGNKGYPSFDNAVKGRENIISTAFSYDFEDTKLDDFVIEDYDEYKDYTWKVENGTIMSLSWTPEGEGHYEIGEDGQEHYVWVPAMNQADERITTKDTYTITPNTVLTFDVRFYMDSEIGILGTYDNLYVQITKDGTTFTEIAFVESVVDMAAPNGFVIDWLSQRVNVGAKLTELGLDYGEYQISLYHKFGGGHICAVDNLKLTERTTVIPSGEYYLVVAAEDAFKLTVTLDEPKDEDPEQPEDPENPSDSLTLAAPVVTATATSDTTIVLTWNKVEGAATYNVYQGTDTVALATVEDTTYTVSGLKAETEYTFAVTAVNDTVESAKSAEVKVTTLKPEGIEELSSAFNIYPNPVKDELFIATEESVKEISIYDIYGRQAMRQQVNETTSQQVVNVADLNSGIYFVKIVTSEGEVVKRFVKK